MATSKKTTTDAKVHLVDIGDFVVEAMTTYGVYVNEERAVPDLFDGLKPVQRRLMFAARSEAKGFTKTARLAGTTVGKFHPHGTASAEEAIITLVNSPTPLLYGDGNWGTLVDGAAAARYTNVRLSNYSSSVLLASDYLAITPRTPNYDRRDEEPIILPALLPNVLLNGSEGIGVGVTTKIPSYTPESVISVLISLLNGEDLEPQDYAKRLVLAQTWGATPVKSKENFDRYSELMTTSKGSVVLEGRLDIDADRKRILLGKFPTSFGVKQLDALLNAIRGLPNVRIVYSGKGVSYVVEADRRCTPQDFVALTKKVQSLVVARYSFSIYVTERVPYRDEASQTMKYRTKFHRLSVPDLLKKWLKRRIHLEVGVLNYRIKKTQDRIAYLELLMHAAKPENIDVIAEAIKTRDPKTRIMKGLGVTAEQADVILSLKISQLARLSIEETASECSSLNKLLKSLKADLKSPENPVKASLASLQQSFVKAPRDVRNWNCLHHWLGRED